MLLALALLAFVSAGITPLFMASVKSNYSGNEYTSINMLARDRLEQLMNLPFDDGQLTPGIHGERPAGLAAGPRHGAGARQRRCPEPLQRVLPGVSVPDPDGHRGRRILRPDRRRVRGQRLFVQADRRHGDVLDGAARDRHSPVPRQRRSSPTLSPKEPVPKPITEAPVHEAPRDVVARLPRTGSRSSR